jgi:Peptidase A4 family
MTRLFRPAMLATLSLLVAVGFAGGAGVASASTHTRTGTFLEPGGPLVRPDVSGNEPYPTQSVNWSGYAVTAPKGKKFTNVSGSFKQPRISCTGKYNVSSNWVGLDGFDNETVEQDGTAAFCGGSAHMTPTYYAWIEMFPLPTKVLFRIKPGDHMKTSVTYSGGTFHLSVMDVTSGKHGDVSAKCAKCARASAEWIIERPAGCSSPAETHCFILRMADFHVTTMEASYARLAGGSAKTPGQFGFGNSFPINAISVFRDGRPGFISIDEVSQLKGPDFSVVWNRAGSVYPIQL